MNFNMITLMLIENTSFKSSKSSKSSKNVSIVISKKLKYLIFIFISNISSTHY